MGRLGWWVVVETRQSTHRGGVVGGVRRLHG